MEQKDYPIVKRKLIEVTLLINPNHTYTKEILNAWCEILSPYPLEQILYAFDKYLRSAKFVPKPADIIEILNSMDGRPDAGEAWNMVMLSFDENETLVMTDEMMEARGACCNLYHDSGEQAARLSFRDAYNKAVTHAREIQRPIKWTVTLGHDGARRNDALKKAVVDGYLTQERAQKHLISDVTREGAQVIGLITGKVESIDQDEISEVGLSEIEKIKQKLGRASDHKEKVREQKRAEAQARRDEIESKKKDVERYINKKDDDQEPEPA